MAMDGRIVDSTALRFNVGDAVNVVFRRQPPSIQRRTFLQDYFTRREYAW